MKTLKNILFAVVVIAASVQSSTVRAQMSNYRFNQLFNQGFSLVMEAEYEKAETVFARLHKQDETHGQVNYLLGFCKVKQNKFDQSAIQVLASAATTYSYSHQRGRVEDRTAPAKAWFYLAQANAATGNNIAAIEAYRNYMTCIQMASLDHKREIVLAIKKLKNAEADRAIGVANELASKKP